MDDIDPIVPGQLRQVRATSEVDTPAWGTLFIVIEREDVSSSIPGWACLVADGTRKVLSETAIEMFTETIG